MKAQTSPYHEMRKVESGSDPENGNSIQTGVSDVVTQSEVVLRSPSKSQSNGGSKIDAHSMDAKEKPVKTSPTVSLTIFDTFPFLIPFHS